VGNGWGSFTTVFNGGGSAIKPDGDLLWYAHDGFLDGSVQWRGPTKVGNGWGGFRHVFSAGEFVVYGVQPDGRLLWYRHDGAPVGGDVTTWVGQGEVASGWQIFDTVFSGGDGVLYGIRADGVLERRKHKGYLTGTADWEPTKAIGTGWKGFRAVVGAGNGVIYAFTNDGRILWYRHAKRREHRPSDRPNIGSGPGGTPERPHLDLCRRRGRRGGEGGTSLSAANVSVGCSTTTHDTVEEHVDLEIHVAVDRHSVDRCRRPRAKRHRCRRDFSVERSARSLPSRLHCR
jgi:Tachylectin